MSVRGRLASALGRTGEQPNIALAEALAATPDATAVAELVEALTAGSAAERSDCIKVLYELGERRPEAIAPHTGALLALLGAKNNRLVWGALHAVATLAPLRPREVGAALPNILAAADAGSVIAKDQCMRILVGLAGAGEAAALPLLLERLQTAADNQFPMYAELALPAVPPALRERFAAILETRLATIDAPAKRARVAKLLRAVQRR